MSSDSLDSTLRRGHERGVHTSSQQRSYAREGSSGGVGVEVARRHFSTELSSISRGHLSVAGPTAGPSLSGCEVFPPVNALAVSMRAKDRKKAFTEFHNSHNFGGASDATSPYLGDDPSVNRKKGGRRAIDLHPPREGVCYRKGQDSFEMLLQMNGDAEKGENDVADAVAPLSPILNPILYKEAVAAALSNGGKEPEREKRERLILPAALALCPDGVLERMRSGYLDGGPWEGPQRKSLNGLSDRTSSSRGQHRQQRQHSVRGACWMFLGEAMARRAAALDNNDEDDGRPEGGEWSVRSFALTWNYILEFAPRTDDGTDADSGRPLGFAHLQDASILSRGDGRKELVVRFHEDQGRDALLLRLDGPEERDGWMKALLAAASLTLDDVYSLYRRKEIGRGRYSTVCSARRRMRGRENFHKAQSERLASFDNGSDSPTQPNARSRSVNFFDSCDEEEDKDGEGHNCALKIVNKSEFWDRVQRGGERADTLARETAVQATLSFKPSSKMGEEAVSPFLRLWSFFETRDEVTLELELLGDGLDLFRHVSLRERLPEDEAAWIMRDLLSALATMADMGIAHRDVKPANIFMCKDGPCNGGDVGNNCLAVKLGDFGMSAFICSEDGLLRGRCGTPGYVAPELLRSEASVPYENRVDIFSAGVTLYVMLCGYEPFFGETEAELVTANRECKVEFDDDWDHGKREPYSCDGPFWPVLAAFVVQSSQC